MSATIVKCSGCSRWTKGKRIVRPYSFIDFIGVAMLGIIPGIIAVELSRRSWLQCPHCNAITRLPTSPMLVGLMWLFGAACVTAAAFFLAPELLILWPSLQARIETLSSWMQTNSYAATCAVGAFLLMLLGTVVVLSIRVARFRRQLSKAMMELDPREPVEPVHEDYTFAATENAALRRGTNPFTDLVPPADR